MNLKKKTHLILTAPILTLFIYLFTGFLTTSPLGTLNNENGLKIFYQPATKKINIADLELIKTKNEQDIISLRACPNEYEPISLLLYSDQALENLTIEWSSFKGNSILPDSVMEAYVVKGWYQAGITSKDIRDSSKKVFTQELLLKDDSLVVVDTAAQINFLRVLNVDGVTEYIDISSTEKQFPDSVTIYESRKILPFSLDSNSAKQLWFTIQIPSSADPGVYNNWINLLAGDKIIKSQQIMLEVLPFSLDSSIITYGIFYHGIIREDSDQFSFYKKTAQQLISELTDLKNHGIEYPTNYNDPEDLRKDLIIRNNLGFPNDKIFLVGLDWFSNFPESESEIDSLLEIVKETKKIIEEMGGSQLYVYGVDEAGGQDLINQRKSWKAVKEIGVKMFVATNKDAVNLVGDLLDIAILNGELIPEQADLYHAFGNQIFSYHNPQVGQENPEVYRRNFGLALWKAGYDGAMNYAYFKSYGNVWNDFDDPKQRFREETFVYPTSDGLISTIQWEGFREGIDDVKYLSTLLNKVDKLKVLNVDVSDIATWIAEIDPNDDLDQLRKEIIDKILEIDSKF